MKQFLAIISAASVCFAQLGHNNQLGNLFSAKALMTDAESFNSYYMNGSPLGIFQKDSSRLTIEAGYHYSGWQDVSLYDYNSQIIKAPRIRIGAPKAAFFELSYRPQIFSASYSGLEYSLPVHGFGIMLAGQTPSGLFQASLKGEGYTAKQSFESSDSSRFKLGLDILRIDLGSQVHPLVQVGFYGSIDANIDTLTTTGYHQDRFFQLSLPSYGGYLMFGSPEIPVTSNMSAGASSSRFVYVSKGVSPEQARGNERAFIRDSLYFNWQSMAQFALNGYALKPAFLLGTGSSSGQFYTPHEENDPLKLGPALDGQDYNLGHFELGFGLSFEALRLGSLYTEYYRSAFSLECGSNLPQPEVSKRAVHTWGLGVTSGLHHFISLPLQLTPRLGYFVSGSTSPDNIFRFAGSPFSLAGTKSQQWRYEPQNFLSGFNRTSGFILGLDGTTIDNRLGFDLHVAFLSRSSDQKSGTQFGSEVRFSVPEKSGI